MSERQECRPGGIYKERLDFCLPLVAETDLHIGAAASRELPREDGDGSYEVAQFLTTSPEGLPYIPTASLKGALRALAVAQAADAVLFGHAKSNDDKDQDRMGLLLLRAALPVDADGLKTILRGLKEQPERRTSIDRRTGAAADGRLFAFDKVPAGTAFLLKGRLLLPEAQKAQAEAGLARLLSYLGSNPIHLGRNSADGQGRMRFGVDDLKIERRLAAKGGKAEHEADWLDKHRPESEPVGRGKTHRRIELACDGPYLTVDPYAENSGDKNNVISGQRRDGRPVLLESSLTGALRSRAAFQWRAAGRDADNPETPLRRRWLANRQTFPTLQQFIAGGLSPIERLFGVNGLRARLQVASIEGQDEGVISMTSVALDRFSMAPIQGALFTFKASLRPRFSIVFALEQGTSKDDIAFFDDLLNGIKDDEIMLGHGGAKGFGWFLWKDE